MICLTPFVTEKGAAVPCGRCAICRKNRVRAWMFRLMQEDKVSSSSYFVTWTYDTQFVPITPRGFMTLEKKHIQDYMKRLRKKNETKIRYYIVGEYGPKTERPHYHGIIFNADSDTISPAWGMGDVQIGNVSGASVSYCAGYISKPGLRIPKGDWDDRIPQFSLMSKGIGENYLSSVVRKWHIDDLRTYVVQDEYKIGLPRYYRKKLFTEEQRELLVDSASRKRQEMENELYREAQEKYPGIDILEYKYALRDYMRDNEKFIDRKL